MHAHLCCNACTPVHALHMNVCMHAHTHTITTCLTCNLPPTSVYCPPSHHLPLTFSPVISLLFLSFPSHFPICSPPPPLPLYQPQLRAAAVATLNAWYDQIKLAPLVEAEIISTALATENPNLRSEVLHKCVCVCVCVCVCLW